MSKKLMDPIFMHGKFKITLIFKQKKFLTIVNGLKVKPMIPIANIKVFLLPKTWSFDKIFLGKNNNQN
jgi:hypothetical protein